MFTLRRISGNGVQMNQAIGESYTFVHRNENYEEFKRSFRAYFERDHVADGDDTANDDTRLVYAFIGTGTILQPLYKNQSAYIMTAGGKTFDNIGYAPHLN